MLVTNEFQVQIRQARVKDSCDIARLSNELGYPSSEGATAGRLQNILNAKDHRVLVACTPKSEIVGWIHVYQAQRVESDSFAEIGGFIVSESARNKGVGRKLLQAAEAWAMQNKLGTLRVRSRVERLETHRFYVKRGFVAVKEQTVFEKIILPCDD